MSFKMQAVNAKTMQYYYLQNPVADLNLFS